MKNQMRKQNHRCRKMLKKVAASLLGLLLFVSISGCQTPISLNQRLLIRGIGIDWEQGEYTACLQANQVCEDSQVSVILYTAKGTSILEALRNVTKQEGKIPEYSHDLTVLFGQGAAEKGLEEMVDFFFRSSEIPSASILIVCEGKASDILSAEKEGEIVSADTLGEAIKAGEYNGQTVASDVTALINQLVGEGNSAYLPFIRIVDEMPESAGTAILNKDGIHTDTLDSRETRGLLIIIGRFQSGYLTVCLDDETTASLDLSNAKTEIQVTERNGIPVFSIFFHCSVNINALDGGFNKEYGSEYYDKIRKAAEAELQKDVQSALNVCIFENKLDVFQFGRWMHKQQRELWSRWKDEWKEKMDQAEYVIHVETDVERVGKENTPSIE